MQKKTIVIAVLCGFILGNSMPTVHAGLLDGLVKIVKTGGIAYLVDRNAGDLNKFINSLTAKYGVSSDYATKVVPVITVGNSSYVGAAQVSGPQALVDECQSALQLEGNFLNNGFRVKALIPIDSKNPTNFSRVQGVGVSAQIDVKI
ncbi:MAG: hypothetical protein RSF75_03615 [Acidaminococcaceae bacterium]